MTSPFRIFISAATKEFGPARDRIASALRARNENWIIKVQRDFPTEPNKTLLTKLHDYIRDCDHVICIIGREIGSGPQPEEAAPFNHLLPAGTTEASYSQWEYHFARHYNRLVTPNLKKSALSLNTINPARRPQNPNPADRRQIAFVIAVVKSGFDFGLFSNNTELFELLSRWKGEPYRRPPTYTEPASAVAGIAVEAASDAPSPGTKPNDTKKLAPSVALPSREPKYTVEIPATTRDMQDYIALLFRRFRNEAPPAETLLCAHAKNKYSIIVIKDRDGIVVGGVEAYGLKNATFQKYLDGRIEDHDLRGEDILSIAATRRSRRLYTAIIVDGNIDQTQMSIIAGRLLCATLLIAERAYFKGLPKDEVFEVYAVGASPEGEQFLLDTGYKPVNPKGGENAPRKDKFVLYCNKLTPVMVKASRAYNPVDPSKLNLIIDDHRVYDGQRRD